MIHNADQEHAFDMSSMFNPSKAGLLVVDVQEKLWGFIDQREQVLKKIIQAIEVAGNMGMPILVTEQYVKGLGPTIEPVSRALRAFSVSEAIEKFDFSCFGEPKFAEMIEEKGFESLALVGIEAHVCVMQTALDALDRNMDVYFIAEATGSRNKEHKNEAVARVKDTGAIVGSVEMFAFECLRTSKHPAFKKVQKVIV